MATYLGWDIESSKLNPNLFLTLYAKKPKNINIDFSASGLENVFICGKITSSSVSSSANWESGMEGANAEGSFSMTSALAQSGMLEKLSEDEKYSGYTFISENESVQIWKGVEPLTISITIEFIAFRDSYKEVEAPIQYLYKMIAPKLGKGLALGSITEAVNLFSDKDTLSSEEESKIVGEIPFDIVLDRMNTRFNSTYVLESISEDQDKIHIDSRGNRIRQEVSLSFKSKRAMTRNATDIIIK